MEKTEVSSIVDTSFEDLQVGDSLLISSSTLTIIGKSKQPKNTIFFRENMTMYQFKDDHIFKVVKK